ncbi:MAG: type II toxin-antitoxin system VapC family toxin [Candidatus Nanoarchaeia archaeon]|nr:type II toxin-antitoxin system VapC family toxin [Candidatus Nanoarchaeia archaeon]
MMCYVDSNVFISMIFDESGRNNLMSYYFLEFFKKAIEGKYELIISELVIEEFCKITKLTKEEFTDYAFTYCGKIRIIKIINKDIQEVDKINSRYHKGFSDALHLVVAKREKCEALITWNKKDFEFAENEILITDPKDLCA